MDRAAPLTAWPPGGVFGDHLEDGHAAAWPLLEPQAAQKANAGAVLLWSRLPVAWSELAELTGALRVVHQRAPILDLIQAVDGELSRSAAMSLERPFFAGWRVRQ